MRKEKIKEDSKFMYEEVIRRNSEAVYRLAYSLVGSRSDADDIYQEVFLRYVRKNPAFESAEHEKAWFLRVTMNCCKNFWKSSWVQRRDAFKNGILEKEEVPESREEDRDLIEAVKQLPEKYRAVIHLFYYEELSVEEIGKITKSKASTVRTRLTRARRILKSLLKEKGEDYDV